jgi:hypothetical protein
MGLEEGSDQELRGPILRLLRPIFDRGGVPALCGDDGTRAEVAGQGRRFALPRECPQLKIEIWGTRFCGFDQRWATLPKVVRWRSITLRGLNAIDLSCKDHSSCTT